MHHCCSCGNANCAACAVACATVSIPAITRSTDGTTGNRTWTYTGDVAGSYDLPYCRHCGAVKSFCGLAAARIIDTRLIPAPGGDMIGLGEFYASALTVQVWLARIEPTGTSQVFYIVDVFAFLSTHKTRQCCNPTDVYLQESCVCEPWPNEPIGYPTDGDSFVFRSSRIFETDCPVDTTISVPGDETDVLVWDEGNTSMSIVTVPRPALVDGEQWAATNEVTVDVVLHTSGCSAEGDCTCSCSGVPCLTCEDRTETPGFYDLALDNPTLCESCDEDPEAFWDVSSHSDLPTTIRVYQNPQKPCEWNGQSDTFTITDCDDVTYITRFVARMTPTGVQIGIGTAGIELASNVALYTLANPPDPGQPVDCESPLVFEPSTTEGLDCDNQPESPRYKLLIEEITATPVDSSDDCEPPQPPPPGCSVPCEECGEVSSSEPCLFCPDEGKTMIRIYGSLDFGVCDNCDTDCPGIDCNGCCVEQPTYDPANCANCGAEDGPEAENCPCLSGHDRESCLAAGHVWCCHTGAHDGDSDCSLITLDYDVELPLTSYTATTMTFSGTVGGVQYEVVRTCSSGGVADFYEVTITVDGHCIAYENGIGGDCDGFSGTITQFTDTDLEDPDEFPCQYPSGTIVGLLSYEGCES